MKVTIVSSILLAQELDFSLTKDLVELHGGTISVESEVDHGTEFMVRIPIERSYYDEEQIDDEAISLMQNPVNYEDTQEDADVETQEVTIKANTILLVEDNGELLHLMTKLLSREYNVFYGPEWERRHCSIRKRGC